MATISAQYRRRLPPVPSPEPPLVQFIVLSMLLHVLVVLLFGTPQRGGVGSLGEWRDVPFAVTLRALLTTRESPFKPSHGVDQGSAGSPLARRQTPAAGGATATPPPRSEPPRVEAPSGATEAPPVELPPAEPTLESPPQDLPAVPGTLPRLDRGAPEVVDKAVVPDADVRPQEPSTETRPRVDLEAPRKVLPEPPPPLPAPVRREPPAITPPASAIPTPKKEPVAIPKLEAPAEAPVAAPPQVEREIPKIPPVVAPAAPPSETQPSTLPRIEQEATPKVESEKPAVAEPPAKREVPAETIPRVEPEAAPKAERPVVPPAPAVSPREAPPVIAPPRESAPAVERAVAPTAPQVAPREAPAEAPARAQREAPQKSEAASPRAAQPPALREAPAAAPVPRLRYGQPPDVDDIFAPRQPGETPAAGAPPPIDLDAARKAAREPGRITSGRTGIIPLNLFPPPPEPESRLGRAIQKAAQPDCREAYAAMGLLAIPFLLKDTVTDTGCRW